MESLLLFARFLFFTGSFHIIAVTKNIMVWLHMDIDLSFGEVPKLSVL